MSIENLKDEHEPLLEGMAATFNDWQKEKPNRAVVCILVEEDGKAHGVLPGGKTLLPVGCTLFALGLDAEQTAQVLAIAYNQEKLGAGIDKETVQ